MKYSILLALSLLLPGCQTDQDAQPQQVAAATEEFEVEMLGRGLDCGLPLIDFKDKLAQVEQITGRNWGRYYATGLSPDLWSGKVLLVRIRRPADSELRPCTALGPAYPWVTIVSARIK